MPASYVHQCVASDACDALGLFESGQLRAALRAGSEGPDPFFFSLFCMPGQRPAPRLGSVMHQRSTDDFLIALARACAGSDVLRAYCCGFFTHYGTDTTFHPFVYAHSQKPDGSYSGAVHCTLEHGLETLHYRRRGHTTGLPLQMAGYIRLTSENKDEIARALAKAIAEVFPADALGFARVRRAFDDAVALCNLLRSESGRKYRALGAILSPTGLDKELHAHMMPAEPPKEDIANDARRPWASPWQRDVVRRDSFSDLYTAAIARAKELVPAVLSAMDGKTDDAALRRIAGANSYDSGLPWRETRPAREVMAESARTASAPTSDESR